MKPLTIRSLRTRAVRVPMRRPLGTSGGTITQAAERIAREAPKATLLMYPDGNHVCDNIAYKYRPAMSDWMHDQLR